jgi:hypothetical protein
LIDRRRSTSGSFFPRNKPVLAEKAPLTPRTLDCNAHIQRILANVQRREEHLQALVERHKHIEIMDRIPKLPPLRI